MKQGTRQYEKRQMLVISLLVLIGIASVGLLLYALGNRLERTEKDPLALQEQTQLSSPQINEESTLEYRGVQYQPRKNLTSILLIGVRKIEEADAPDKTFHSEQQADFLSLLVFDDQDDTIKRIDIDRNIMTEITMLGSQGKPNATRNAPISAVYGFGSDEEHAAILTVKAVSNLLQGLEIKDYVTFSMNSIAAINDLVGGVEVTIEEDLTDIDPVFVNGEQVILQGVQADRLIHARKNENDDAELQRMQRLNAFFSSLTGAVLQKMQANPAFAYHMLNSLKPYMTSSLRISELVYIIYKSRGYTRSESFTITGERKANASNNREYYPDDDSIMKALIGVFYKQLTAKDSGGT